MFSNRFLGIAALAAALAFPAAASAQQVPPASTGAPQTSHHRHHRGGMMRMMRNLNLSTAQRQQIQSIAKQSREQNRNVTDPGARRANNERMHQQVEAVLTPAQRTQFHQEMQQRRARRNAQSGMPAPAPVPH